MTQGSHYSACTQKKTIIQEETCTPRFTATITSITIYKSQYMEAN